MCKLDQTLLRLENRLEKSERSGSIFSQLFQGTPKLNVLG